MRRTIALFTLSISFLFPVITLADAEQIETPPPKVDEMVSMIPPRTQSVSVTTVLETKPDIVNVDGICNFTDTFPSESAARSAITNRHEMPATYDPSTNTSLVNATLNVTFEEESVNPANR